MSETMEVDELERRVVETLRAKAAQVAVAATEFDAQRTPVSEMIAVSARRPRLAVLAFATAIAVAAAATGVVIVTRPGGHSDGVVTESSSPAALFAPTWVPAGEHLWSLTANASSHAGFVRQLFGNEAPDGSVPSGLMVDVKRAAELRPGFPDTRLRPGTPVVVRGLHGVTRSVVDADIALSEVEWIEGDTDVTVTVRGVSPDAAVLVLDALRPRGSSLMDGFDPADGTSSFRLLGQDLGTEPGAGVDARFEYSAASPLANSLPDYSVSSSSSAGLAGYLRVWLMGRRTTDGTTVDDERDWGVTVVWPDGRQITARTYPADHDVALLERIARSAMTLDDGPAATLAAEAEARVAALPVLGTATLPAGDIEFHGTAAPVAVCLRVRGSAPACGTPFQGRAFAPTTPAYDVGPAFASAVIDGKWYVFGASRFVMSFVGNVPPSTIVTPRFPSTTPLPSEKGTIDGVNVALVVVPAGTDSVTLEETTASHTGISIRATRPGTGGRAGSISSSGSISS